MVPMKLHSYFRKDFQMLLAVKEGVIYSNSCTMLNIAATEQTRIVRGSDYSSVLKRHGAIIRGQRYAV